MAGRCVDAVDNSASATSQGRPDGRLFDEDETAFVPERFRKPARDQALNQRRT